MMDKMNGQGLLKWMDGRSYEGLFNDGKYEGRGVAIWPVKQNERIQWTGPFVDGKAHGTGELAKIVGEVVEPPVSASYV